MKSKLISLINTFQAFFLSPKKDCLNKVPYFEAEPGNCGLGCVAMVLKNKIDVNQLADRYKKEPYYLDPVGWSHQGLVFILGDNKIEVKYRRFLLLSSLVHLLSRGKTIIISVKVPSINNLHMTKLYEKRNLSLPNAGHLCLLVGFNKEGFIINDPRNIGIYKDNLIVSFKTFAKIFSGNGVMCGK